MSLRSFIARWISGPPIATDQAELAQLAVKFRQEIAGKAVDEMTRRDIERENHLLLRREIDTLRSYRREAEVRMMRHGIEIPSDDLN